MTWHEYLLEAPAISPSLERVVLGRLQGRLLSFWVEEEPDGLVLHGQAPSYHVKQLAQCLVMEMCEQPIVANLIEVRPSDWRWNRSAC